MGIYAPSDSVGRMAFVAATIIVAVGVMAAKVGGGSGEGASETDAPGSRPAGPALTAGDVVQSITTGGSSFDPAILTSFIPGTSFVPYQGSSIEADLVRYESPDSTCVSADATGGGVLAELRRGVTLPDGARIKRVTFLGSDADATHDIGIRLSRTTFNVPSAGAPTKGFTVIDSFSTTGAPGTTVLAGADNLGLVVGTTSLPAGGGIDHVLATLHVQLRNSSAANHRLCGVEIEYQAPVSSPQGSVFHPVTPYRAYDARLEMAPIDDGPLAAGPGRLILVKDGRDINTGAINQVDAIPATATAIAFTVTVASPTGSGFLFVGPGGATAITASTINWGPNTLGAIANSSIVELDGARQIRVFAGGSPGAATHFIIDVTGYYAPPDLPNMGN